MKSDLITRIKATQRPFFDGILVPRAKIALAAIEAKRANHEYIYTEADMDAVEFIQNYADYSNVLSKSKDTHDTIEDFCRYILALEKAV